MKKEYGHEKSLFLLSLLLAGFYGHVFAAYHLYITNYIKSEKSPEWVTLSRHPAFGVKINAPDTYPFETTTKVTFYNIYGSALHDWNMAFLTIGTRDFSHHCYIRLDVENYFYKDYFKIYFIDKKGADCRFSKINSNTGKIDIMPIN